ncbi:MAG: glutathione S-transferase N-terminal domain-containing protein [Burkholderiales bacterium]
MKLIGNDASPFARKVRIVLAEKKIEYEYETNDPWGDKSAIWGKNPLAQVPVLLLEDDTPIFDSRVIVEFLDNASPRGKLIPSDNRERIEVRRWEALADGVLDAGVLVRRERARPDAQRSDEWIERQMKKVDIGIKTMAHDLAENAWCAGNGFTLADIAVGVCLGWLTFRFPEIKWRESQPGLAKLMTKLEERQSFADTVPKA